MLLLNENALIDFSTKLGFSLSAIELLNLGVFRDSNLDVLQVGFLLCCSIQFI